MQTMQLKELLTNDGLEVRFVAVNPPYRPQWLGRIRGLRALLRLPVYMIALWRGLSGVDVVHLMANSGWSWHLFAMPAILISRLRGKPVLVNYRGGMAEAFLHAQASWVVPIMRRATLVVPSEFLRHVFSKWGLDAVVVPNVVRLDAFCFKEDRKIKDVGAPVLVVTRNLETIYGVDVALQAFARLQRVVPDARLLIAGEGVEGPSLRRQADKLGVDANVEFVGRLSRNEIIDLYASADILLNTSRVDNTPNSLIEAMATGVAIVSTRAGGIPYLVTDGVNALLCDVDDVDALTAALLRLIEDPDLYRRLVDNGHDTVEGFSWGRVRERWFALYDEHRLGAKEG